MAPLRDARNLKEMAEGLQAYLLKVTEEEGEETAEERKNDRKIKTYLIESNIQSPEGLADLPMSASLTKTEDPRLMLLRIPHRHDQDLCYVDSSNPRFWSLHTNAESGLMDAFVEQMISRSKSHLDNAWFSSDFLEGKCNLGVGEGFGLRYQNTFANEVEGIEEKRLRSFSMLFWGGNPKDVLERLRSTANLASGVTLSRVKQVFRTEHGYVKENISGDGKFTLTKGNSFESHLLLLDKIKASYQQLISKLESEYRIRHETTDYGLKVRGTYCTIRLGREIEDLEKFLDELAGCTLPFRIFGMCDFVDREFAKVAAVDLHTSHKFNMEVAPTFIRVFLSQESCGNVVTRLLANLQQFYDSQTQLIGYDNERIT